VRLGVFAWDVSGTCSLSDGVSKWSVSVVVIDDCVYWSFYYADAFGNGHNNPPLYSPAHHMADYMFGVINNFFEENFELEGLFVISAVLKFHDFMRNVNNKREKR
jgi:hypothetical protein